MSFLLLRSEIQAICEGMGLTYIRATEDQANVEIDNIDTFKDLAIHIDRTTILGTPSEYGNYVTKEVPTEILFLTKNPSMDEMLMEVDNLVDAMEVQADTFYDLMIRSDVFDKNVLLPGYSLERLPGYKRFDTVLSGVQFMCDIPVPRLKYYCNN